MAAGSLVIVEKLREGAWCVGGEMERRDEGGGREKEGNERKTGEGSGRE